MKITKLKSGCFHPTMTKYREIILETSPVGAVQLLCLSVFHSHFPSSQWRKGNRHTLCDKLVCQTESLRQSHLLTCLSCLCVCPVGTSVMQVTATDADDPTYGNSARLVYSILQGQPYFSVEPQTGETETEPLLDSTTICTTNQIMASSHDVVSRKDIGYAQTDICVTVYPSIVNYKLAMSTYHLVKTACC